MATIEDFLKLELKVGKIIDVNDHPQADKLYLLTVDIGNRNIQLVAGIKKSYLPEELVGKKITVIANLEPKIIRGCESQGMLLAAQDGDNIVLIVPDKDISCGSSVR